MAKRTATVVALILFAGMAQAAILDETFPGHATRIPESKSGFVRARTEKNAIIPVVDLPVVTITAGKPVPGTYAVTLKDGKWLPVVNLPEVEVTAGYNHDIIRPAARVGDDYLATVSLPEVEIRGDRDAAQAQATALSGDERYDHAAPMAWLAVFLFFIILVN